MICSLSTEWPPASQASRAMRFLRKPSHVRGKVKIALYYPPDNGFDSLSGFSRHQKNVLALPPLHASFHKPCLVSHTCEDSSSSGHQRSSGGTIQSGLTLLTCLTYCPPPWQRSIPAS